MKIWTKTIWFAILPTLLTVMAYLYIRDNFMFSSWAFYIAPFVISSLTMFVLSIILNLEIDYKKFAVIFIPMPLTYILLYAVEPLAFRYDAFFWVGICGWILPLAFAGSVVNIFAFWLGSIVHGKIFNTRSF